MLSGFSSDWIKLSQSFTAVWGVRHLLFLSPTSYSEAVSIYFFPFLCSFTGISLCLAAVHDNKNIWDNQLLKRESLFWLTLVKVLVRDWLLPCFGACGKTALHGKVTWWSKTVHLMTREQKEKGRNDQGPTGLVKNTPPVTWKPPTRPDLLKAPLVLQSATPGTKPLTHGPVEDTSKHNFP